MKTKRYQIKPALILCGVMALFIVVIFVMAGNINRNVAKNMKGRILYDEIAPDGSSAVVMYDFESGESVRISEKAGFDSARGGVFIGADKTAFIVTDGGQSGIYIYDVKKGSAETAAVTDKAEYIDIDYFAGKDRFVCLFGGGTEWRIEEIAADGTKISEGSVFESENRIYAVSYSESGEEIYFVQDNGNGGGTLKSVKDSRVKTLYVSEKSPITGIEAANGALLVCEDGKDGRRIAQYNDKRESLNFLQFNSDSYECAAAAAVSSTQFVVSADKGGHFEIYVCNGSNMVRAEGINSDGDMMVTDYFPE